MRRDNKMFVCLQCLSEKMATHRAKQLFQFNAQPANTDSVFLPLTLPRELEYGGELGEVLIKVGR